MNEINKIIKYIIIRFYTNNNINNIDKNTIKIEILKVLELINILINKIMNEIMINRKYLLSRINKLEKLNHINDYKLISYNFNKNEIIRKSIISKLIINLLENIMNGIKYIIPKSNNKNSNKLLKGNSNTIIISKPVIKENLNKVEIIFYYFIPNYKSLKWFNRINMFLNKSKDFKELSIKNNKYSKTNNLLHDKLITFNIFNNIINYRNNVKINSLNVNTLINTLINNNNKTNNNIDNKLILKLKKSLNNNLNGLKSKYIKTTIINNYIMNIKSLHNNNNNNNINNNINNNLSNILLNNNNIESNNLLLGIYNLINKSELNNKSINKSLNINNNVRYLHNNVNLNNKDLVLKLLLNNNLVNNNKNINNINNNNNNNITLIDTNKNNNNVNIFNYMILSIDRLLNKLNDNSDNNNGLSRIISKYFGDKEINIKGINLKYEFNNSEILVKLIRKGISKRRRTLSRSFRFRLKNRIPLLNDKGILKTKISNTLIKNISLNNNILNIESNIKSLLFNKSLNINNTNNNTNMNIINDIKNYYNSTYNLSDDILYKYIIGWSLLLKGKVGARKGKNRSNRILMSKGSLKNQNLLLDKQGILNNNKAYSKDRLKLNYIKNSNLISYIDKSTNNGKLGLSLIVNEL